MQTSVSLNQPKLSRRASIHELAPEAELRPRPSRGPLRPNALISTRERAAGALRLRFFQAFDTIAVVAAALAALALAFPGHVLSVALGQAAPYLTAAAAALWGLDIFDLYEFAGQEPFWARLAKIGACGKLSALVFTLTALVLPTHNFPMMGGLGFGVCLWSVLLVTQAGWTALAARWRAQGRLTPNIVIIGATPSAEALVAEILGRGDINVLGIFDDRASRAPSAILGVPVLGTAESLLNHRTLPYIDRILIAMDGASRSRVRQLVGRLSVLPQPVSLWNDAPEPRSRAAALDQIAACGLSRLTASERTLRKALLKRLVDITASLCACLIFAPLMLLVAVAIKLDSPGPILFRQRRHGFNNEVFSVWKFRSMQAAATDPEAAQQVVADDARVTRIGRFIRPTGIDELPQIFNVLIGEMSLVGPRPHAVGMKTGELPSDKLVSEYAWRHRIKPGLTGWAAVCGSRGPLHCEDDIRRRVMLDIEYVERQNFWFDLYIMIMTVPRLFGDKHVVR